MTKEFVPQLYVYIRKIVLSHEIPDWQTWIVKWRKRFRYMMWFYIAPPFCPNFFRHFPRDNEGYLGLSDRELGAPDVYERPDIHIRMYIHNDVKWPNSDYARARIYPDGCSSERLRVAAQTPSGRLRAASISVGRDSIKDGSSSSANQGQTVEIGSSSGYRGFGRAGSSKIRVELHRELIESYYSARSKGWRSSSIYLDTLSWRCHRVHLRS